MSNHYTKLATDYEILWIKCDRYRKAFIAHATSFHDLGRMFGVGQHDGTFSDCPDSVCISARNLDALIISAENHNDLGRIH